MTGEEGLVPPPLSHGTHRAVTHTFALIGNILAVLSLGGLLWMTMGLPDPVIQQLDLFSRRHLAPIEEVLSALIGTGSIAVEEVLPEYDIDSATRPITEIRLPSISLSAPVVPSRVIDVGGATTWEVPAFKVGHAEGTVGAGQPGNAVLLGHVASQGLGNVFLHLERVRPGDIVHIASDDEEFAYRVEEIHTVSRTDVSVIEPSERSVITLLTCTGLWLPQLKDYSERLIVRAVLEEPFG